MTYMNIELYGSWQQPDDSLLWEKEAILFYKTHEPFWRLGERLEQMVKQAGQLLCRKYECFGWKAQPTAALLIKLAMEEASLQTGTSTVATPFEPSLQLNRLSEYLWRILLLAEPDDYEIRCYRIAYEDDVLQELYPVDWRSEAQAARKP